jgi:hypothetical protein
MVMTMVVIVINLTDSIVNTENESWRQIYILFGVLITLATL